MITVKIHPDTPLTPTELQHALKVLTIYYAAGCHAAYDALLTYLSAHCADRQFVEITNALRETDAILERATLSVEAMLAETHSEISLGQ